MTHEFKNASYWVGCSTESASRILFNLQQVMASCDDHAYIAAFDLQGNWVDEARVEFDEQDNVFLNFEF